MTLNLNNNLLIENETADAIINMICQNDTIQCNNQLESLELTHTHITSDSFIKLISKVNQTTIKKLKFCNHGLT